MRDCLIQRASQIDKRGLLADLASELMHRIYQNFQIVRIYSLVYAVPQIKYMAIVPAKLIDNLFYMHADCISGGI